MGPVTGHGTQLIYAVPTYLGVLNLVGSWRPSTVGISKTDFKPQEPMIHTNIYVYIYIFIHMPHMVSMASHQSKLKHPFFECFCFCFCFCLFASVSFLPISCHLLVWVCIHRAFCSTHGSWLAGACPQDISATADAGARSRSLHS